MRCVVLGDGRRVSLTVYVAAWKRCLTLDPATQISRGISGYGESAEETLRAFRYGLHDRINRHMPRYGKGRKWSPDWQRAVLQAANAVNTPRLIVRWLPADLMKIPRLKERVESGRSI